MRELPNGERAEREARIARIATRYDQLSAGYQAGKDGNDIPLR